MSNLVTLTKLSLYVSTMRRLRFFLPSSMISPCGWTDWAVMLPLTLGAALLCSPWAGSDMWLYYFSIKRYLNYICLDEKKNLLLMNLIALSSSRIEGCRSCRGTPRFVVPKRAWCKTEKPFSLVTRSKALMKKSTETCKVWLNLPHSKICNVINRTKKSIVKTQITF